MLKEEITPINSALPTVIEAVHRINNRIMPFCLSEGYMLATIETNCFCIYVRFMDKMIMSKELDGEMDVDRLEAKLLHEVAKIMRERHNTFIRIKSAETEKFVKEWEN